MKNRIDSQIILYQAPDGTTKIEVKLQDETVWLTQDQMSILFQTDRTSIIKHLKNIFETGELDQNVSCAKIAQDLPGLPVDSSKFNCIIPHRRT
jgi:hypothetical protein